MNPELLCGRVGSDDGDGAKRSVDGGLISQIEGKLPIHAPQ